MSGPNDLCPAGYDCVAEGFAAAGFCGPTVEVAGCCSTGGRSGDALPVPLALSGAVGLLVARRRRGGSQGARR